MLKASARNSEIEILRQKGLQTKDTCSWQKQYERCVVVQKHQYEQTWEQKIARVKFIHNWSIKPA